jgi:hemerythrin-like domain-containing protein
MAIEAQRTRRDFLRAGTAGGTAAAFAAAGSVAAAEAPQAAAAKEAANPEVTPVEDLMREHGVLRRVLMIYDEAQQRLGQSQEIPDELLVKCARLIRRFIEDYHEKSEEQGIFPRFTKGSPMVDLVVVLRQQHQAGRRLTDQIERLGATVGRASADAAAAKQLSDLLRQFTRMYRAHAAREDTVLFPALHSVITAAEYDKLGDQFEDKEHELFGENGFEKMVAEVAEMEKSLGIGDLAALTPA